MLLGASASYVNQNTLGVTGVGAENTIQPQTAFSIAGTGHIRLQLFREHELRPLRATQDSSMFTPILPDSSSYKGVAPQMNLAAPRLPSPELRRPLSPDLSDVSDSEAEFNRLPLTPAAAATAVSRQQSFASHASHTSRV